MNCGRNHKVPVKISVTMINHETGTFIHNAQINPYAIRGNRDGKTGWRARLTLKNAVDLIVAIFGALATTFAEGASRATYRTKVGTICTIPTTPAFS